MQLLTCCKKNNNHLCFKRLVLHVLLFDIGYFLLLGSDVQPAKRVTRGPNKYLEIWDLPDDQEIELPLNSMHQPVDEGARTFTGFLGTVARKPHMCPIKYLDWKAMPEELKEECWRLVKVIKKL